MIRNKKVIGVCLLVIGVFFIVWITTMHPIVIKSAKDFYCQDWTGFCASTTRGSGKTLWDWLELSSRLAVPIFLFFLGYQFQKRDKKRAEEQAKLEKGIARDNLSEEAIQAYLDRLADLLLNEKLRNELFPNDQSKDNDNSVRDVARIWTITLLRRLEGDKDRQERIIHFLFDAELFGFILKNANLSRINLKEAYLPSANLKQAHLKEANLTQAYLEKADLEKAYIWGVRLDQAFLWQANLYGANLNQANLSEANLSEANLYGALLWRANLSKTNFYKANLSKTNLSKTNLNQANLNEANLYKANLYGANLNKTHLNQANLNQANLLDVINLTSERLKLACNWEKAIYKDNESENTKYIEELKKDKSSDPKEPPDCSRWNN